MKAKVRTYVQAYFRGLKIISRGEAGPRLGCTGLLFAALFILMGLVFSFYTGNRIQLECTPQAVGLADCQIQARWYGLLAINTVQVQDVKGARVDEYCDDSDCSYRVLLALEGDEFPLTEYYSTNRTPKAAAVQRILEFLSNPDSDILALEVGGAAEVGIANILPPMLLVLGLVFGYYSLRSLRLPSHPTDPRPDKNNLSPGIGGQQGDH